MYGYDPQQKIRKSLKIEKKNHSIAGLGQY